MRREKSLQVSMDQFMPVDQVLETLKNIELGAKAEINMLNKNAEDYQDKYDAVIKRAAKTKYRAMKQINKSNEKVPDAVKAAMIRRGSSEHANKYR